MTLVLTFMMIKEMMKSIEESLIGVLNTNKEMDTIEQVVP